jgi:lipopolysaccharide/colanic/teichoic acid biosynthesis glycosyltransferase
MRNRIDGSTLRRRTKGGSLSGTGGGATHCVRVGYAASEAQEVDPFCSEQPCSEQQTALAIPRWKRRLDLICIVVASPVWLFLMVLLAIWIKLVSRGPILYRQVRVGRGGEQFTLLKFRSMIPNAETLSHEKHVERLMTSGEPMTKLDAAGDSRLILGARILRAFGLDELPQIFNVIRGEMSLVGPRPCLPSEFSHYTGRQRNRVNCAPGLTGYWQVHGKNATSFEEMIEMDLHYGKTMGPIVDVGILLRTIPAVVVQVWLTRRGAYRRLHRGSDSPAQRDPRHQDAESSSIGLDAPHQA